MIYQDQSVFNELYPEIYPKYILEIYQSFVKGINIIRRFERFWGGSSPDQVIEQELMRDMKISGL